MFGLPPELTSKIEKLNSRFYKIIKSSLKPKGERILIISDYGQEGKNLASMFAYGFYHATKNKKLNVELLFQEVKKGFMFADDHVTNALNHLEKGSIVVLILSKKLGKIGGEKSFRNFCRERDHRFVSSTGLGDVGINHFELFLEAMSVNYSRLKKKALMIKKKWDKAKEIRVKTEAGTDLTFNVEGMKAIINIGEYHQAGTGGNMPAGEVYIPPKGNNKVNGKIVVDGSIKTDEGGLLVDEPLILHIVEGRVIGIEGKQAPLLEKTFERIELRAKYPERVRLVSELAVGINPGAVLIGSMIMDEKVLGTGHIAMGSNYWFGGEIKTIFHGDQVFKKPVYYLDGVRMEY